jgi:hypothetical protein
VEKKPAPKVRLFVNIRFNDHGLILRVIFVQCCGSVTVSTIQIWLVTLILKGIVSPDAYIFRRFIIINMYLLSVHARIVFTIFCCLVDEKISLKV